MNNLTKAQRQKELIEEIELNKEYLGEHELKFVESVCEFYYKNGFITEAQEEWLIKYLYKIEREILDDGLTSYEDTF